MRVLAYIDGSRFTESVAVHAAWAARQLGTGVQLVHVLEYGADISPIIEDQLLWRDAEADAFRAQEQADREQRSSVADDDERRETLHHAAREIRSRGVERVQTAIEYGSLEDHIREHSRHADLVVLGRRGEHTENRDDAVGDHLERAIRASSCPVLVAPSELHEISRFLLAFSGGAHSGNAVRYLIDHPLLQSVEGTLLLAGDHPDLHQQLEDAAGHLRSAGYNVTSELGPGDPDRLIPDIMNAEDIDLLVMGAFGHPRVHAMLGLSTTRKLLRSSTKAILVVP